MNKNTGIFVALVAILVIAIGGYTYPQGGETVRETIKQIGAAAGPEHTERQIFKQGSVEGGDITATSSTATSYTLTTAELRDEVRYVSWTPNVNTTLTTMASTSEPFVGLKAGESYSVYFYNASTTAASTVTFAAGTGVDLQEDEGETVIVNGLEVARLTFLKKSDSDVIGWVEVGQVGD